MGVEYKASQVNLLLTSDCIINFNKFITSELTCISSSNEKSLFYFFRFKSSKDFGINGSLPYKRQKKIIPREYKSDSNP